MKKVIYTYIEFFFLLWIMMCAPLFLVMITHYSGSEETLHRELIELKVDSAIYETKKVYCETFGSKSDQSNCNLRDPGAVKNERFIDDERHEENKEKHSFIKYYIYLTLFISSVYCFMQFYKGRTSTNESGHNMQIDLLKEVNKLLEEKNQKLIERNIQLEKMMLLYDIKSEEQ
ncbi:hypothetical protein [Pseudoalteromonas phenolica]|uniref:Uncharacterized protein n=1 Tax=Pseudoalteromonas phenolica TaxID=161398 RepID=A0A0S2K085_9GAMM|nr:hypothetical protein [Pseudoalteromonas phenolica]ALO41776.1 hypothetical protein PP2015_1262 [Pseudoalteromonas phenolica]